MKEAKRAESKLSTDDILSGVPANKRADAKEYITNAQSKLEQIEVFIKDQDISNTLRYQQDIADAVYQARLLSMPADKLPFEIPDEYSSMPTLRGLAKVECVISKPADSKATFDLGDAKRSKTVSLLLQLDGYHAPLTTGNFVDLVQRKFYDGLPFNSVDDLIVQTGKPSNSNNGFIDPKTREQRTIPLELFYKNDVEPTYGYTSDDDKRATESMADPFQAYGMAHDPEDPNTASSQFWFLKWDQALVAPSRNTLDGSQACLGYIVSNEQVISQINNGDEVSSIRVVEGIENFHRSSAP